MGVTCKICRVSAADFDASDEDELAARVRYGAEGVEDLDKAWDGILWLISEERRDKPYMLPDPDLAETQSLLPPDRISTPPIGYATPERVRAIAAALADIDEAQLRARFDGEKMAGAEVYPSIWIAEPDALDYLVAHFETLRDVYRDAAAAGDYVLVSID